MGSRSTYALALVLPALILVAPVVAQPRNGPADPTARPGAASIPGVLISPDHSKLLVMERTAPSADGAPSRTFSALVVQPIGRGETRRLILPWRAKVKSVLWAPDGDRVAFTIIEDQGVSLWVGDPYSGVIRMLAGPVLSSAKGEPCRWFHSGEHLLCARVPEDPPPGVAAAGSLRPAGASQLAVYSLSGSERRLGHPAIHGEVSVSPDGSYLLVETGERTASGRIEVWDASSGAVVRVIDSKVRLGRGTEDADAVASGPRSVDWRGDKPATLVWAEAQDGGSPGTAAKVRDRLYQLANPFTGAPVQFAELEFRSREIVWGGDNRVFVSEGWNAPRRARSWIVKAEGGGAPRLLQGPIARTAPTGSFVTRRKQGGGEVLLTAREGRTAYLVGPAYLDQIDLATGQTQRLWRAQQPFREELVGVIDAEELRVIIRRGADPHTANYFLRDLKKKKVVALTSF